MPPGDAFNITVFEQLGSLPTGVGAQMSQTVPAGKELVILQIMAGQSGNVYSSRLPSPNHLVDPINVADLYNPKGYSAGFPGVINYPDGTVVIDEGRQLWGVAHPNLNYLDACSVVGYYRDK